MDGKPHLELSKSGISITNKEIEPINISPNNKLDSDEGNLIYDKNIIYSARQNFDDYKKEDNHHFDEEVDEEELLTSNEIEQKRFNLQELINSKITNSKSKDLFIQLYNTLMNEDNKIEQNTNINSKIKNHMVNQEADTLSNKKFCNKMKDIDYENLFRLNKDHHKKHLSLNQNNTTFNNVIETYEKIENKKNISVKFKNKLSDIFRANFNVIDKKSKKHINQLELRLNTSKPSVKKDLPEKFSNKKAEIFNILFLNPDNQNVSSKKSNKLHSIMNSNLVNNDKIKLKNRINYLSTEDNGPKIIKSDKYNLDFNRAKSENCEKKIFNFLGVGKNYL